MNFIRANFRHYCIQQFYPEKNANEWFSHAALNSSNPALKFGVIAGSTLCESIHEYTADSS